MKILLIDDQPTWLRINERALTNAGFVCETFKRTQEALDEYKKNPEKYGLIIIDVNLGTGQKNGVKAAEEILSISNDAKLVLISSAAQLKKHELALEKIAQENALLYVRKKGDEEGGAQILHLAKQHLFSPPPVVRLESEAPLSPTGAALWAISEEESSEED